MNPTRLVCFDLGGVLVRISKGWHDVCARTNLPHPGDDHEAWKKHLDLLRQLEVGKIDQETYQRHLPECLPMIEVEHVLRAFDAWLLGLYPGVSELLTELKSRRIPTAICSNTNPRHWDTVLRHDDEYAPLRLIDHPFASHLLGCAKPSAQIYEAVEQATGIAGESILFFDDLPANIAGATTAGWQAQRIDPDLPTADQIRSHLKSHGVL